VLSLSISLLILYKIFVVERETYTYDEAFAASLRYFGGDELAARVWVNKYALKDSYGHIYEKTPDDMHWRLANELARIEQKYSNPLSAQELFDLMAHFRYIVPQGSPMTGIGNDFQIGSLSNCFVVGLEGEPDSYGGIIKIDEEQVQLMKRRGGVGHDLSHIRQRLPRQKLGPDLDRIGALYGALLQLDARGGARRPSRSSYAHRLYQAPRFRGIYRCQADRG